MSDEFIVWDDAFSVGHNVIDDQHKELAGMINELTDACKRGDEDAALASKMVLDRAVAYAKNHFADEEKYMSKASYPGLWDHKKEHQEFMFEVVGHMHEIENGTYTPIDFAKFLKSWVLNHIAGSDKKYEPYLKKMDMFRF